MNITDNLIKNTLMPCHKCKGIGKVIKTYDTEKVVCQNCGAKTETHVGDYYDEGFMDGSVVIPLWNKGQLLD